MIVEVPFDKLVENQAQSRLDAKVEEFADQIAAELSNHRDTRGLFNIPIGRVVLIDGRHDAAWEDQGDIFAKLFESNGRIELITGHRRVAALRVLHCRNPSDYPSKVQIDVRHLSDRSTWAMHWKDNDQALKPTPLERGFSLQHIMKAEGDLSREKVAELLGCSLSTVATYLRLADAYPNLSPRQQKILANQRSTRKAIAYINNIGFGNSASHSVALTDRRTLVSELSEFISVLISETERALFMACGKDASCRKRVERGIEITKQKKLLLLEELERHFNNKAPTA